MGSYLDSGNLLTQGYLGNMRVLPEWQRRLQITNQRAAQICGVSPATYYRWKHDRKPNLAAVKLLAILAGYVPWPGWENWEMDNGYLFPPGFSKNGISPGDWHALVFQYQLVSELRRKNQELEAQLQDALCERPAASILRLV